MIHPRYTIDLLKGEGIPIRSRPGGIAFACLIMVVPFLVVVATLNYYTDCEVVIAVQRQQVSKIEATIQAMSGPVQKKDLLEKERAQAAGMLSEVGAVLGKRTQWTPALVSLIESLSDSLMLTKLEARRETVRCKVPAQDDPSRKIEISVPARALKIYVCGKGKETSSEAVKTLQESLRASAAVGPMLDTITVSRNTTTVDSQEAVHYELNCVFKPIVQ
jgi:Tfp pilus assembly protein PilN